MALGGQQPAGALGAPPRTMCPAVGELERSRQRVQDLERELLGPAGSQVPALRPGGASAAPRAMQAALTAQLRAPAASLQLRAQTAVPKAFTQALRPLGHRAPLARPPLIQPRFQTAGPQLRPWPQAAEPLARLAAHAAEAPGTVHLPLASTAAQAAELLALAGVQAAEPLVPAVAAADSGGLPAEPDEEHWTEVFKMLHEGGESGRAAQFALTIATLKRKGEDIQQQIDALQLAEGSLMQAARDEAKEAILRKQVEPRGLKPPKLAKHAKTWGQALATAVARQVQDASSSEALEEPPSAATLLAHEAQQQVTETLEAHTKHQAEAQAQAVAQAEQALMLQAEAVAQAQAIAEAQATALSEVQAQAQAVAEMQLELQAEAQQAQEQQAELEAAAAERQALRAQGLNSKKLPLRPGVPPCSYFMRRGECKYGKTCKWDHPEAHLLTNSKGYSVRPGSAPCPFYLKTGACNFAGTCKFDHPEAASSSANSDIQSSIQALTQAAAAKVAELQASAGIHAALAEQEKQQQLLLLLGQ